MLRKSLKRYVEFLMYCEREVICELSNVYKHEQLRKTAIYVNASSQRTQVFYGVQTDHPAKSANGAVPSGKLRLLQDVKTRWNSTYLMCVRCLRLQEAIDEYWGTVSRRRAVRDLKLSAVEWKKVEYLVELMKPYAMHGVLLGASVRPTIGLVWEKYMSLFDHIDREKAVLGRKQQQWKTQLVPALDAARKKLDDYFQKTKSYLGELYNIGTMLNPSQKNRIYRQRNFEVDDYDTHTENFRNYFKDYYSGTAEGTANGTASGRSQQRGTRRMAEPDLWELARMPPGGRSGASRRGEGETEATEYLNEGEYAFSAYFC